MLNNTVIKARTTLLPKNDPTINQLETKRSAFASCFNELIDPGFVIFHIKRLINLLYMMDRGKNPGLSSRKETYRFASFVEHAIREGENSCRKRGGGRPRRRYLTK